MTQMIETLESRALFSATVTDGAMMNPMMLPAVQLTARKAPPTLNPIGQPAQPNLVVISIIAILIGL